MGDPASAIDLAERVAQLAAGLHIETALIGAYALAAHGYVRGTADLDLGSHVELEALRRLQRLLDAQGLSTELVLPDDEDPRGGVLRIWEQTDEEGTPIDPVEVVNFLNPLHPQRTPAREAIRTAVPIAERPALRYPSLAMLIALKLYAHSWRDDVDIVELLLANPDADIAEVRAVCAPFGLDRLDGLIATARAERARR